MFITLDKHYFGWVKKGKGEIMRAIVRHFIGKGQSLLQAKATSAAALMFNDAKVNRDLFVAAMRQPGAKVTRSGSIDIFKPNGITARQTFDAYGNPRHLLFNGKNLSRCSRFKTLLNSEGDTASMLRSTEWFYLKNPPKHGKLPPGTSHWA